MKDSILIPEVLSLLLLFCSLFITWLITITGLGVTEYLQTALQRYQRRASLVIQMILFTFTAWSIEFIININQPYAWTAIVFGLSMLHCAVYMFTDMQISRSK